MMQVVDSIHVHPVTYNKPVKSILPTHYIRHHPPIRMTRDPIQFVVSGHQRKNIRFFNRRFIWWKIHLTQCTFRYVHRSRICSVRRFATCNKMLGTSQSHFRSLTVFPLKSLDGSHPHAGHQIRVFSKSFTYTPPTGITRYINIRSKCPMSSCCTDFQCSFTADSFYQLRMEAGSLTDRRGIYSSPTD